MTRDQYTQARRFVRIVTKQNVPEPEKAKAEVDRTMDIVAAFGGKVVGYRRGEGWTLG